MKVKLISSTPEPERTVAAAARLCYSPVGAETLLENFTREEEIKLLEKLIAVGHYSPLEHASFTFAVEGISRALSHQLVRHRIASYSQQSQRYVSEENFEFIIPPSIQNSPAATAIFNKTMNEINQAYQKLSEIVPKEDARFVLPQGSETKIVLTFNARSLLNFFEVRLCQRAQWEIRKMASLMLLAVKKEAPILFAKGGPTCETMGICYEGELSCGRAVTIKSRAMIDNILKKE